MTELAGLPAVVTGSSRGLGRAFALALAAAGARVVVNGTDEQRTTRVVDEIRTAGGHVDHSDMDEGLANPGGAVL